MLLVPLLSPPHFPAADFSLRRMLQRNALPRPSLLVHCASKEVDAFTQSSGYLFEGSSEAESLTEYSISKISAIYKKKPLIVIRRLLQTGTMLGKWFALRFYDRVAERDDFLFKDRAAELRKILVQLGPAYVKIAQAVSSRADLIPPSYLDELSLLQDRIAPFSSKVAFQTIEQELGMPLDGIFSEITPEPVAAASLGQVYQARLRSNGKVVAVKVQRPGVRAAISLDILILRYLAGLIKRAGKLNTDLQSVIDEWASSLFREMDYNSEAKNGVKFRKLYGSIQDVIVPEVYLEQTTSKVITMQWIEGQKLAEVKDMYMIEVGVYCSLNQLLECGFYHADPHPGNLLRTFDGKLAYLDFGMMGEFKQELQDAFIEACLHLVNRDYDALAKDFVNLGFIPPTADKDAVAQALTGVFRNAVSKGVRNISFGDLVGNLGTTMYRFKFRIPSYFSLVIRSLAVLEGIAVSFDPDYKVLSSAYPWIARKVLTDTSPTLNSSLKALLYKDGVFRIDRLESLVYESLRVRTERLTSKEPVEGSLEFDIEQILAFALNEKVAFVRELILDEIVKGMDALGLATLDSIALPLVGSLPFEPNSSSITDEDLTHLRNLQRLIVLFSKLQQKESSTSPSANEAGLVPSTLASGQEILSLLSSVAKLPQDSRQQLLRLPADLAGKLVSRAIARTIMRVFL